MYINDYNITASQYEVLYKRYLERPPDELLLAAGPITGKKVLDLCAGTLRASNRAKGLGAACVVALDKSSDIIPKAHLADHIIIGDINRLQYLGYEEDGFFKSIQAIGKFDLIVCQQGINYWFNQNRIFEVANLLQTGGNFIFNTFNKAPSKEPTIKKFGGGIYGAETIEIVQLVGDVVYHLQMLKDFAPHYTSFRWITPDEFSMILNKYFSKIQEKIKGNTTIYMCEK